MVAASPVLAAVALAAIGLAGCLGSGALPTTGDGDGLDGGDTWTTEVLYRERGDSGTATFTFVNTVASTAMRHGHRAYEVAIEADYGQDRPNRVSNRIDTAWYRVSDLALIERGYRIEGYIFPDEDSPDGLSYSETSTFVYDEPCPSLASRPVEVGMKWTVTCIGSRTTNEWNSRGENDWHNGTRTEATTYKVVGQETVKVRAGTFEAYKVTSAADDGEDWGTAWVVPGGCPPEPVRAEGGYENEEHAGETLVELVKLDC